MYSAWGETRYSFGATPTDRLYTGQYEAEAGLYFYNARWYDNQLGRFAQADTIVPDPYNPLDWNRYAYARYNPVNNTDPSKHYVFENDPDEPRYVQNDTSNTGSDLLFSFDTKTVAEKYIPFTSAQLKFFAMDFDHFALAINSFAELIVLGYVGIGTFGGTIFEGNPVSGIPSGAGAGWILGEFNPFVQGLVTFGNGSASLASVLSITADVKSGDSRLQFQVSQSTNNIMLKGSACISSNSVASGFLTIFGWQTRVVEMSLLAQGAAVAVDHGVVPTFSFSIPFIVQYSSR